MIMQFYSTSHFYPNGRIVWMTEGVRYQSSVLEWATLLGIPGAEEDDIDVYVKPKMDHNTMSNMYTEIPNKYKESHKLGYVYHLLAGLTTSNTIMRHTLMPKSEDEKMIRGHSINMLHHIDQHQKFKVMDRIVETVKRTDVDQKRSRGFAPHIKMLINSKGATKSFLFDREHLPLQPEFEDNTMMMDPSHPTSVVAQEEEEAARTIEPSAPTAPFLKTKNDQMNCLLQATRRIERSLANLADNHKSLKRIIETKFYDLDVKVTEMQTTIKSLKKEVDEAKAQSSDDDKKHGMGLPMSTQF